MRILVTGGAGFIGSHLCERLLADGHEVICLDNFFTGRRQNVLHLLDNANFELLRHDVIEPILLEVDQIYNLACPASPVHYQFNPVKTVKTSVMGTINMLGLAKRVRARILQASTSEVYGDPQVHPQPEEYWGNVNCIGIRSCYDESKRLAETLMMDYHRQNGVDTRIARIFNSILADETVFLFNHATAHVEPIEDYVNSLPENPFTKPRQIYVPAFNPETFRVELRLANTLIKHPPVRKDAYEIRTRYGRRIRVTGDHSVFRRNSMGKPEAIPVRKLQIGDHIAIPSYLPVLERDVTEINVAEHLIKTCVAVPEELWQYALISPQLVPLIEAHKELLLAELLRSGRYEGSADTENTVGCLWRKYHKEGWLPLPLVSLLWRSGRVKTWPIDALIRPHKSGGVVTIPNQVTITNDLLWLIGLYLAEGCAVEREGDYRLLLSSDAHLIDRAAQILASHFGVRCVIQPHTSKRATELHVDSKLLLYVFKEIFQVTGLSKSLRIPAWIMQLPLARVKYFLEGYREGDGTHTNYLEKRELVFNTASEKLATDLTYLLLRFRVVASVGEYESTIKQRYPGRTYRFWRVTVCEVSDFNLLTWDEGVKQTLNARCLGDLVWAQIRSLTPVEATSYVYDFSVEGFENFVAGNGVFAHNTYGPRMLENDGRVVSNFIVQVLRGEELTIYGTGEQTRSFCYVDDLIEALVRLMNADALHDPVNLGNPGEFTIKELAMEIARICGVDAPIKYYPLPQDDPRQRQPDITRARQLLGWEPTISLREGLERTIAYFREQVGRPQKDAGVA
jgi:UDP-glucuronate decarboxylase